MADIEKNRFVSFVSSSCNKIADNPIKAAAVVGVAVLASVGAVIGAILSLKLMGINTRFAEVDKAFEQFSLCMLPSSAYITNNWLPSL